jgi:membrane-bound lytic murein transglycosylase D
MNDLVVRNQLSSAHLIRVGRWSLLPVLRTTAIAAEPTSTPVEHPIDGRYTVRSGDTLTGIAAHHSLTAQALAEINGLRRADRLYPGQVLALSAADPGETGQASLVVGEAEVPSEATLVRLEAAEPVAPAAIEDAGTVGATPARPAATADPADYEIAVDGTIEVQAVETLGHYADWLGIPTQRLRGLNGLYFGQAVVIGRRLRLDFSIVDAEHFTSRRIAYHRALQEQFFRRFHIADVREQQVRIGGSLWSLAQREPDLPVWLLRQYNPDLDFSNLHPGTFVIIPRLASHTNLEDRG